MPRFLHTADLHINALRRLPGYLERASSTLQAILDIAVEEEVDFILVAGDIFEHRDIKHSERQVLSNWLANSTIPIAMISGNHDKRSEDIGDTIISYLSALTGQLGNHLIYDGPPTVEEFYGCQLVLLPYQGWTDQEIYLIVSSLLARTTKDLPIVVVMHEAVKGSETDSGFFIKKKDQIVLDFFQDEVAYWALGDIHKCQAVHDTAWYSGSPHQVDHSEDEHKGVLLVDTSDPANPEFISVGTKKLVKDEEDLSLHRLRREFDREESDVVKAHIKSGLLDGLVPCLLQQGLPRDLISRSLELLSQIGSEIRLDVKELLGKEIDRIKNEQ